MAQTRLTIEVTKFPEALAAMRRELANALRREADAEADPRIARVLRRVAADFEVGVSL